MSNISYLQEVFIYLAKNSLKEFYFNILIIILL